MSATMTIKPRNTPVSRRTLRTELGGIMDRGGSWAAPGAQRGNS
jgi:hypothetical protein